MNFTSDLTPNTVYTGKDLPGSHYDIVICSRGIRATTGKRKLSLFVEAVTKLNKKASEIV